MLALRLALPAVVLFGRGGAVAPPDPLEISGTPSAGEVGSAYSFTPTVEGGTAPYTFSYTGWLPDGVSFNTSTGALSGTAVTEETIDNLVITVTDALDATEDLGPLTITIAAGLTEDQLWDAADTAAMANWNGKDNALYALMQAKTGPKTSDDQLEEFTNGGALYIANSQADLDALAGKLIKCEVEFQSGVSDGELFDFAFEAQPNTSGATITVAANVANLTIRRGRFNGMNVTNQVAPGDPFGDLKAIVPFGSVTGLQIEGVEFTGYNCDCAHNAPGKWIFSHDQRPWNTDTDGTYDGADHPHKDGIQVTKGSGTWKYFWMDLGGLIVGDGGGDGDVSSFLFKPDAGTAGTIALDRGFVDGGTRPLHAHPDADGLNGYYTINATNLRVGTGYRDFVDGAMSVECWSSGDVPAGWITTSGFKWATSEFPAIHNTYDARLDPENTDTPFTFSDTFDRADENVEANANWSRLSGGAGSAIIVSNAVNFQGVSVGEAVYRCPDTGSADHGAEVTLGAGGIVNNNSYPVACRITDVSNFVGARYASGGLQLFKRVSGTLTQLGSTYTVTLTAGDRVALECVGDTATVYLNDVAVITQSLAGSHPTAQRAGFVPRTNTSNIITTFEAYEVA